MSELSYLRLMQETDLHWVLQVEQQSYDFPWSQKGFENSLDQGVNYIFCSAEHEMMGYACVLTVLDEAQLLNFCIAPAFRKSGIGRAALQQLMDKLKQAGYEQLLLEVRESNLPAQKLYLGCGFQTDGVRRNYYRCQEWREQTGELVEGKEDALLMSRSL
ncbi:ribosomal protein S18-alanine N-acetyltransferase [Thiomicrorhabdus sp. zzn3]|uniref:ribosomal protein S18-alanine N-acetyltransferase n=1 Tax=Thiomicrorhabdus sp. zzn3 TaxID=3039775 RepID=UPI002436CCEC|nr:ribosomal protein S18-alanine N-acetyltransferase [Thiomicrorhabdus sp. zzn3]MDG6778454.1 ribosomal protein S18-alanine N-acetyltransferase [Thiomicrorhabdus sp. zzn3]